MKKVTLNFDFSKTTPRPGNGSEHTDGVLGTFDKNSPEAIKNQQRAALFNEYERTMRESAQAIGDYDFKDSFENLDIDNIGDAIRRLKLELDAALGLLSSPIVDQAVDYRFYGIERDWVNPHRADSSSLRTTYFTPGHEMAYEPTFEILSTENRKIVMAPGVITLPERQIAVLANQSRDDKAYVFDVPALNYSPNVDFVFGPTMQLPTQVRNKIHIKSTKGRLAREVVAFTFNDRVVGSITTNVGAGRLPVLYTDITNSLSKEAAFVLVQGSLNGTGTSIDTNQPFVAYFGTDTKSNGLTLEDSIPSGFDAMIDPDTGDVVAPSLEGDFYIYYLEPEAKAYVIGINVNTGLPVFEEASIIGDTTTVPDNVFALYLIRVQYEPILSELSDPSFLVYRRVSHPLEHSVDNVPYFDSIVDLRRFRKKGDPIITYPWFKDDGIKVGTFDLSDTKGSTHKILPMFFPVACSLPVSTVQFDTPFRVSPTITQDAPERDQDAFGAASEFAIHNYYRDLYTKMVSGRAGVKMKIVAPFVDGNIQGQSLYIIEKDNLNPGLIRFRAKIYDSSSNLIYEGTTFTPRNPLSWSVVTRSEIPSDSTNLAIEVTLEDVNQNLPSNYVLDIRAISVYITPVVTKKLSTATGDMAANKVDHIAGDVKQQGPYSFNSSGHLAIRREYPLSPYIKFTDDWVAKAALRPVQITNSVISGNVQPYTNAETTTIGTMSLTDLGLTQYPKYWKYRRGLANDYILYVDQNSVVRLARISISDPTNYTIATVNYDTPESSTLVLFNPSGNMFGQTLELMLDIAERPRVVLMTKHDTKLFVHSYFYLNGIENTVEKSVYYQIEVDTTDRLPIGLARAFEVDSESQAVLTPVDRIDSFFIYFDDGEFIYSAKIPSHVWVNNYGFLTSQRITWIHSAVGDVSNIKGNKLIVYSENNHTIYLHSKEQDRRSSSAFCGFVFYDIVSQSISSRTVIKPFSSYTEAWAETTSVGILGIPATGVITPEFFVQRCGLEVNGLDSNNHVFGLVFNPYNQIHEMSERVEVNEDLENIVIIRSYVDPSRKEYTSYGAIVLREDANEIIKKEDFSGIILEDSFRKANIMTVAENLRKDIFRTGIVYDVAPSNSEVVGFTRKLLNAPRISKEAYQTAYIESYPGTACLSNGPRLSRRLGRIGPNSGVFGESVFYPIFDAIHEHYLFMPSTRNFSLGFDEILWTYLDTSIMDPGNWPETIPFVKRDQLNYFDPTFFAERTPIVELGGLVGLGLEAGVSSRIEEQKSSFVSERTHILEEPTSLNGPLMGVHTVPVSFIIDAVDTFQISLAMISLGLVGPTDLVIDNRMYPLPKQNLLRQIASDLFEASQYTPVYDFLKPGVDVHTITTNPDDTVIYLPGGIPDPTNGTRSLFTSLALAFLAAPSETIRTTNDVVEFRFITKRYTSVVRTWNNYAVQYETINGATTKFLFARGAGALTPQSGPLGLDNEDLEAILNSGEYDRLGSARGLRFNEELTIKINTVSGTLDVMKDTDGNLSFLACIGYRTNFADPLSQGVQTLYLQDRPINEVGFSQLPLPFEVRTGPETTNHEIPFISGKPNYLWGFWNRKFLRNNDVYLYRDRAFEKFTIQGSANSKTLIAGVSQSRYLHGLGISGAGLHFECVDTETGTTATHLIATPIESDSLFDTNNISNVYYDEKEETFYVAGFATGGILLWFRIVPNGTSSPSVTIEDTGFRFDLGKFLIALAVSITYSGYPVIVILQGQTATLPLMRIWVRSDVNTWNETYANLTHMYKGESYTPVVTEDLMDETAFKFVGITMIRHEMYVVLTYRDTVNTPTVRDRVTLVSFDTSIYPDQNLTPSSPPSSGIYSPDIIRTHSNVTAGAINVYVTQSKSIIIWTNDDDDILLYNERVAEGGGWRLDVEKTLKGKLITSVAETNGSVLFFKKDEENMVTHAVVYEVKAPIGGSTDQLIYPPCGLNMYYVIQANGRFRIDTPFYDFLRSTHKVRYIKSANDDLIPSLLPNKSLYTYRSDRDLSNESKIKTGTDVIDYYTTLLKEGPLPWEQYKQYTTLEVVYATFAYGIRLVQCNMSHVSQTDPDDDLEKWDVISNLIYPWQTGVRYVANNIVVFEERLYRARGSFTSGASIQADFANWDLLGITVAYTTGRKYWVGEVITDADLEQIYVCRAEFTASGNILDDVRDNYLIPSVPEYLSSIGSLIAAAVLR